VRDFSILVFCDFLSDGFVHIVLYSIGTVISLVGTGFVIGVRLALYIFLGNLSFLCSRTVLPPTQTRNALFVFKCITLTSHSAIQMFKPVRIVATVLLVASIALVLVGAFALGNAVSI
jgi:hypothetical protein